MKTQENQTHEQFTKEYKALLTAYDVKLTSKTRSTKVIAEFRLKGVTSLDLSVI